MLPIAGEDDIHTPPTTEFDNVIVLPTHTLAGPAIAAGVGYTVTALTALHPVGSVYDITLLPVVMALAVPVVTSIATTVGEEDDQVPPVVVLP
jgi:hypothetical protein